MSSKLDYLQKYLSKGESLDGDNGSKRKKMKKKKLKTSSSRKGGNLAILDDDVDWRVLVPKEEAECSAGEDDPEDKPIVAEVHDESVVRWQPLGKSATPQGGDTGTDTRHRSHDLSPARHPRSRHDSPDNSPPRKTRHDSPDNSPPRQGRHDSPDLSPTRVPSKAVHSSSVHKPSPQERTRWDLPQRGRSDPPDDLNPPHKGMKSHPSKRQKQQCRDSVDMSPPRKSNHPRRRHDSPDISPPRKIRHDSDISPPRRARHDSDISPPRRARHDSDISPPRRARHDSDINPPRRARHDSDISPPRKIRHDSPDINPPRRTRHDSPDLSPPRQTQPDTDLSPPRKMRRNDRQASGDQSLRGRAVSQPTHVSVSSTAEKTASGKKAGLQNAEVLRQENADAREREREKFRTMDPSESGQGAETVYRDKEGRKINPKLERLKQKQKEQKKMEEEEKFMEWGKGVATLRMAEDKVKDELYEMSKPLARYADDEDLERMLKEREREGDPMLKFMKKKPKLTPSGKPKRERSMYKGSFPANRFGIRPGYRWDGVARSNGFEKTWFTRESNKKATADMAYKWSVENM